MSATIIQFPGSRARPPQEPAPAPTFPNGVDPRDMELHRFLAAVFADLMAERQGHSEL